MSRCGHGIKICTREKTLTSLIIDTLFPRLQENIILYQRVNPMLLCIQCLIFLLFQLYPRTIQRMRPLNQKTTNMRMIKGRVCKLLSHKPGSPLNKHFPYPVALPPNCVDECGLCLAGWRPPNY